MFEQNDMSEAQTGIVKISDCSSETFKGMLEFCYTGNVSEYIFGVKKQELTSFRTNVES
uniref:BTB domain-containing protein n=1 Tax=Meloidogyne incognita TaxID=6306 RepID=A0A914NKI8_MELIC